MQCIKKWLTGLLYNKHRWIKLSDNPYYTLPGYAKSGVTFETWGYLLWLTYGMGCVVAYSQIYYWSLLTRSFMAIAFLVVVYQYIMAYRKTRSLTKGKGSIVVLLFMVLLFCLGYLRSTDCIYAYNTINRFYQEVDCVSDLILTHIPEKITINGEEQIKLEGDLVCVDVQKKDLKGHPMKAVGHMVAYVKTPSMDWRHELRIGDVISLAGRITKPKTPMEDGQIEFKARQIDTELVGTIYEGIVKEKRSPLPVIERVLYFLPRLGGILRSHAQQQVELHVPKGVSDIVKVLLLGGSYADIDGAVMKSFSATGLIHILSVSGSHVSLVFVTVCTILQGLRVKEKGAVIFSLLFIVIYCFVVGFNPPMIRAAIMGVIGGCGLLFGRMYQAKQALAISSFGLLLWHPLLILDVSFQLSVGATYGVLIWGRLFWAKLAFLPKYIRGPLCLCGAAQLMILPIQIYYFHMVSLSSFVAAIVILPILEAVIILGATLLCLSFIFVPAICWSLLSWILQGSIFLTMTLGHSPYGILTVGAMPEEMMVVYYFILWLLYERLIITNRENMDKVRHKENKLGIGSYFIILAMTLWYPIGGITPWFGISGQYRIHTVPITSGTAFFIFDQKRRTVPFLYVDSPKMYSRNEEMIKNSLHYYGVRRVELACLDTEASLEGIEITQIVSTKNKEYVPFILTTKQGTFFFGNGQMTEKNLQLMKKKKFLLATSNGKLINDIQDIVKEGTNQGQYIFWRTIRTTILIDSGDDSIHVMGLEKVPDFIL